MWSAPFWHRPSCARYGVGTGVDGKAFPIDEVSRERVPLQVLQGSVQQVLCTLLRFLAGPRHASVADLLLQPIFFTAYDSLGKSESGTVSFDR